MICKKCYYNNEEGSKFCVKCGEVLESSNIEQQTYTSNHNQESYSQVQNIVNGDVPKYNMTSAIVAIVLSLMCCSNIVSIVFAILSLIEGSKVDSFVKSGDIVSAEVSLKEAKKWNKFSWVAFAIWAGVAALAIIGYFAFIFIIAIMSEM